MSAVFAVGAWLVFVALIAAAYVRNLILDRLARNDRRRHVSQMGAASRVRAEEDIRPVVADQFARTVEYIRGLPEASSREACEELWNMPASKVAND